MAESKIMRRIREDTEYHNALATWYDKSECIICEQKRTGALLCDACITREIIGLPSDARIAVMGAAQNALGSMRESERAASIVQYREDYFRRVYNQRKQRAERKAKGN